MDTLENSVGTIVIPCMGKSERFRAIGFQDHKALLPIGDIIGTRLMIERIIDTLPGGWDVRLIVPSILRDRFDKAVEPYPQVEIKGLAGDTEGQSSTLLFGITGLNAAKPVAFTNCDVCFQKEVVEDFLSKEGSRVILHRHDEGDPVYSYVLLDQSGRVVNVAEKKRVGPWAQSGFWKFHRAGLIHKALSHQIQRNYRHTNGEFYLSGAMPMYSGDIIGHLINRDQFCDFGTPAAVANEGYKIG